jgi:GT2 family glycosyltransferase
VDFCFGVSTALSKRTLAEIGGFEALGDTLVEDTEMGRRVGKLGKRVVTIPHIVDVTIDLPSARAWIKKQIYWDKISRRFVHPPLCRTTWSTRVMKLTALAPRWITPFNWEPSCQSIGCLEASAAHAR